MSTLLKGPPLYRDETGKYVRLRAWALLFSQYTDLVYYL